jgi:quercetin dioxygenase-like cupin family protein
MKTLAILIAAACAASPVLAAEAPTPASGSGPILSTQTSIWGQPVMPPPGPVQVTASILEIPAGSSLPVHKHPFLRFGYLLSGRLEVTDIETGKTVTFETGQFVVDPVHQWHKGRALDGKPVRLLLIDQTPAGVASNTILRDPAAEK